jgi:hypothetical protein
MAVPNRQSNLSKHAALVERFALHKEVVEDASTESRTHIIGMKCTYSYNYSHPIEVPEYSIESMPLDAFVKAVGGQ